MAQLGRRFSDFQLNVAAGSEQASRYARPKDVGDLFQPARRPSADFQAVEAEPLQEKPATFREFFVRDDSFRSRDDLRMVYEVLDSPARGVWRAIGLAGHAWRGLGTLVALLSFMSRFQFQYESWRLAQAT